MWDVVEILCYCFIAICGLLVLFINIKYDFFTKKKHIFSNITLFAAVIIFLIFIGIIFEISENSISNNGKYCTVDFDNKTEKQTQIPNIVYNKVIIVGDSRMQFIHLDNKLDIPTNFMFIAKSGAAIEWFQSIGYPSLVKALDNRDLEYHYHVVINMGVNDVPIPTSIKSRAVEYFNMYQKLANEYKNVKFYILSVNPIESKGVYDLYKYIDKRRIIEEFNREMNKNIKETNLPNIYICDSYNNIHFDTIDGLHYDFETNQRILKYISDECIKYNEKISLD